MNNAYPEAPRPLFAGDYTADPPTTSSDLFERLLKLPKLSGLKISPSGQQVIYTASPAAQPRDHAVSALFIADIGKELSARCLTSPDVSVSAPQWLLRGFEPPSVVCLADNATSRGTGCAILKVPIKKPEDSFFWTSPTNRKPITQFEIAPQGSSIAYISEDEVPEVCIRGPNVHGKSPSFNRLRLLDLFTGRVETLYSEDRHVTSLAWLQEAHINLLAITTTETPDVESTGHSIHILDPAKGEVTWSVPIGGAIIGAPVWPSWQSPGMPTSIYFIAGVTIASSQSSRAVYRLDVFTRTITRIAHGVLDCAWQLAVHESRVFVHVLHGLNDEIALLHTNSGDPAEHAEQAGSRRIYTQDSHIECFDFFVTRQIEARQTCTLAFVTSTIARSDEVYTLQRPLRDVSSSQSPLRLSTHAAAVPDFASATSTPLSCLSKDHSATIQGVLFSPGHSPSLGSTPPPAIVFLHGGPYYRAHAEFSKWDHSLVHALLAPPHAFAILAPNYRGSAGRGEPFAASLRGRVGTCDYDDVCAFIEHAVRRGLVDGQRLVVVGWSQGGFLANLCAVRNVSSAPLSTDAQTSGNLPADEITDTQTAKTTSKERPWSFRGAVAGAGVSDWDSLILASDVPLSNAELVGGAPWTLPKDATLSRRGSPIWEVSAARARDIPPVLLLHGEQDVRIPPSQALGMLRALRAKGVAVESVGYPGEGHFIRGRANVRDVMERVVRFCVEVLA